MANITFLSDTFGYQYTYEVENDISDQEITLFAGLLRNSILKYTECQTNTFPLFKNLDRFLQDEKCPNLIGRIKRLVTFVYCSKWE